VGAPGGVGPANRSKAPVQAGGSSSEREEPAQRTWLVVRLYRGAAERPPRGLARCSITRRDRRSGRRTRAPSPLSAAAAVQQSPGVHCAGNQGGYRRPDSSWLPFSDTFPMSSDSESRKGCVWRPSSHPWPPQPFHPQLRARWEISSASKAATPAEPLPPSDPIGKLTALTAWAAWAVRAVLSAALS